MTTDAVGLVPVIVQADARALPIADSSVDLVVTSPPYWRLRVYRDGGQPYLGQVGAESTPEQYLDSLLACTREMIRVLKPTGSIFVNLGDVYQSTSPSRHQTFAAGGESTRTGRVGQVRRKSLVGLPWRYALACIDQLGLILRAEIIWSKPNGLPESVTDRVRRSHEQWFHFVRQPHYYSAVDQIRRSVHARSGYLDWAERRRRGERGRQGEQRRTYSAGMAPHPLGALPGSVWPIPSEPLTTPTDVGITHTAAFPTGWPALLIHGWSPPGICTACGQGRRPVPAAVGLDMSRPQARRAAHLAEQAGLTAEHVAAVRARGTCDAGRAAATQTGTGRNTARVLRLAAEADAALGGYVREYLLARPIRLDYSCACPDTTPPTRPAVVLDPFGGTGTTALAATLLGRHAISIDASGDYARLARWRTTNERHRHHAARRIQRTLHDATSASGSGEPR